MRKGLRKARCLFSSMRIQTTDKRTTYDIPRKENIGPMPGTTLFRSFFLLEDEDRFLSDFQNLRFTRAYRTSYIFRQKHPIGIHIQ